LHEKRADFVQKVQQVSSSDLAMNGLELESVSLTGLDQTSIEHFNANNAFDAEGLTKLTEQIQQRKKLRNDIEQETRVQIETKNLEADKKSLEISRDNEFARLEQEREVEMRRAAQAAEVAREQAVRNQEAEAARIQAKREIDARQIEADRTVEEARIAQMQAIEIARQEQQIAVQNKSREESQAKAEADAARAKAVAAEEQVATSRETEIAERDKRIELIEAAKAAEREAIRVKVQAEAEKDAATNRAAAIRLAAEGEADAVKLRAEADRVRFEVEAAGQRAVNEAANLLSSDQISLQTKLALLKVLPDLVRESAKPLEAIDSIKIVQVDGLTQKPGGGGNGSGGYGGGTGNLAQDAVAAALAYRAQAPVLDGLMKELGLDGSSLEGLVAPPAAVAPAPEPEPDPEPAPRGKRLARAEKRPGERSEPTGPEAAEWTATQLSRSRGEGRSTRRSGRGRRPRRCRWRGRDLPAFPRVGWRRSRAPWRAG